MRKYLQTKKTSLSYSISDSETTIRLKNIKKLDGTNITASDLGDYITFTFDPGTSKEEICSIVSTNVTINADSTVDITNVVRGLLEVDPYTTGGFKTDHGAGAIVVFSNNPQLYNQMANKSNANTFTEQNIFNGFAPQTNTDPVAGNDLTRLSYVQALVLGTLTTIDVVVPGTAGETIVDGNLVYLKTSDNRWWRCDADTASTVDNVLLGIAKGGAVAAAQITNGVLLQGVDNAQSGLVGGTVMFASNTTGGISSTPGTVEVTVGIAKSATELYFSPRFNQQITEDQQDALLGSSGTPSNANRFVTAEGLAASLPAKFGGTGADGVLNVTSGTTTIDLASAASRILNYTSINVSAGATLAFSNPAAGGTVVQLKSQGNVTIAGTIDCSSLGSAGGASNNGAGGSATAGTAVDATLLLVGGTMTGGSGAVPVNTGGAGGLAPSSPYAYINTLYSLSSRKVIALLCGTGGGGGQSSSAGTNGSGGRGGGALYIECGLAWNFTGTINTSGAVGGNASQAGGGGGGGAGMLLALYKTLTANSGTHTNNSGAGGTGGTGGNGGGGGGGASALANGGAGATSSGAGTAGTNGGGGGGGSYGVVSGGVGGASSTSALLSLITPNNYFV